jgi:hypothetical protein
VSAEHPLRHEDLWHTGVVVDDLAAARDELGAELGVTWFEGGGEVRLCAADGTVRTVRAAYALSRQGPHHVELCQAVDGTLWTTTAPGHAHHVGYWTADVAAASGALVSRGMPLVATISFDDDSPPMCAYHRARSGLYVEIVGTSLRRLLLPDDAEDEHAA